MILRIAKDIVNLYLFKMKWRKLNKHNFTSAGTIFPPHIVSVGDYSYGTLNVHTWVAENELLDIGSLVSIADGVKFVLGGNHNFDSAFTYPFKVKIIGEKREALSKGKITIGNDVWIGMDAMILSGVTIGQGAVIAARSLVTKDIPPYAIVGGNPAIILKYRFGETLISKLLNFDFSTLKKEYVKKRISLLYNKLDEESVEVLLNDQQNIDKF